MEQKLRTKEKRPNTPSVLGEQANNIKKESHGIRFVPISRRKKNYRSGSISKFPFY